ncbi:MAG: sodium:calcium antiporter [Haloferacaceae archaeon]
MGIPGIGSPLQNVILFLGAFVLLLIGAEIFTNGVEWLGNRLGVSEGATGSILAAVGTALPETMIPVIAILQAQFGSGSQAAADEVGVGAILGAPFMLATIGMFLLGASTLYFRKRREYGTSFHFKVQSTKRDVSYFLVGYTLAFLAALIEQAIITTAIGLVLVVLYATYVYKSVTSGELADEEDMEDLMFGKVLDSVMPSGSDPDTVADGGAKGFRDDPPTVLVFAQALFALGIIIGGAHLFVGEVEYFAVEVIGMPTAVLALLLAPLATELPEKFNSVIWIGRDKDTLAIGNMTGAMAFQGTLPVTLGILFTSWNLSLEWGTTGFLNGFSAILAIISGIILLSRARRIDSGQNEAIMSPYPFLLVGSFYALFAGILLYHVLVLGVSASGGH